MKRIVLNDHQAEEAAAAEGPVSVSDAQGHVLGTFTPLWSKEEIARAKEILKRGGPWHTTAEVLARLEDVERQ